jgi:3-hydroxyisobutyrate dehydrogenase-like beta-hydroxyacid dehydrogenase
VKAQNPGVTSVGLLFPGEMGAAVGAAAQADVLWASDGRSEATRARAVAAGLRDVRTLDALVAASEIVLSICPPGIAEEVAHSVADAGFDGLYVEANAIAPARAERIAQRLKVVDGSIVARGALDLYLSGADADVEQVAALFDDTDVVPIPLPGGVGAASAIKMAFGGWNKIGVLLAAQAHAIAGAYGAQEALAAEGVGTDAIVRAGPKAWRWAAEMEEIAETCAALGLPDGLGRTAADVCRRWDGHRGGKPGLDELLADLAES